MECCLKRLPRRSTRHCSHDLSGSWHAELQEAKGFVSPNFCHDFCCMSVNSILWARLRRLQNSASEPRYSTAPLITILAKTILCGVMRDYYVRDWMSISKERDEKSRCGSLSCEVGISLLFRGTLTQKRRVWRLIHRKATIRTVFL